MMRSVLTLLLAAAQISLAGKAAGYGDSAVGSDKKSFIDALVSKMTVEDLVLQFHLMFAGDIVGKEDNELYGVCDFPYFLARLT